MLVPPRNYCQVEEQLHRSATPQPVNLPFLDSLNLTTVLHLSAEPPPPPL